MDLGKVSQKLEAGLYADLTAVLRDVALIWRNCRAFNQPGCDVFTACGQLEGVFDKLWRKNRLDRLTVSCVSAAHCPCICNCKHNIWSTTNDMQQVRSGGSLCMLLRCVPLGSSTQGPVWLNRSTPL